MDCGAAPHVQRLRLCGLPDALWQRCHAGALTEVERAQCPEAAEGLQQGRRQALTQVQHVERCEQPYALRQRRQGGAAPHAQRLQPARQPRNLGSATTILLTNQGCAISVRQDKQTWAAPFICMCCDDRIGDVTSGFPSPHPSVPHEHLYALHCSDSGLVLVSFFVVLLPLAWPSVEAAA